mmetsp:Transcript_22439/g.49029  ORF Transcript_22439/g.49029 Transcript_22439/m.49029 type:complete len:279 (+) Transcript_22439:228-1064(+)
MCISRIHSICTVKYSMISRPYLHDAPSTHASTCHLQGSYSRLQQHDIPKTWHVSSQPISPLLLCAAGCGCTWCCRCTCNTPLVLLEPLGQQPLQQGACKLGALACSDGHQPPLQAGLKHQRLTQQLLGLLLVLCHLGCEGLHRTAHAVLTLPDGGLELREAAIQGSSQGGMTRTQQGGQGGGLLHRLGDLLGAAALSTCCAQQPARPAKQAQEDELRLLQPGVTGNRLQHMRTHLVGVIRPVAKHMLQQQAVILGHLLPAVTMRHDLQQLYSLHETSV